ncbi:MAG: hypothetical protein AAFP90_18290, partial [Planctomycetota bacterium]
MQRSSLRTTPVLMGPELNAVRAAENFCLSWVTSSQRQRERCFASPAIAQHQQSAAFDNTVTILATLVEILSASICRVVIAILSMYDRRRFQ